MTTTSITLRNLTRRYNNKNAVDDLSLHVEPGELLALLGPSGCGKTTTLRMVAGFEKPDAGQVLFGEHDVTKTPAEARKVGMVFQNYALFPNLSVAGNVGFGLRVANWEAQKSKSRIEEMLELVGMQSHQNRNVTTLSGGQRQRVALARALAPEPRLLLLDEPLSALDAQIRAGLRTELRRLQLELGITTVLVTHDQEEAMSMSDRVVVMNNGQIEQIGTPRELYTTPKTPFVAGFIGHMNTLAAQDLGNGHAKVLGQTIQTNSTINNARLGVRPERLEINPSGVFSGTVLLVTYLGAQQHVLLESHGQQFVAVAANHVQVARGENLRFNIAPDAWVAL